MWIILLYHAFYVTNCNCLGYDIFFFNLCILKLIPDEDEMALDEEFVGEILNKDLEQQISNAIDPRLLQQLVC